MELYIILIIVFWHWVADFILQSEEWAFSKSYDEKNLLKHTSLYSISWVVPCMFFMNLEAMIIFVTGTFFLHTFTDAITSSIVYKKFKKNHLGSPIPSFGAFSIIGLDQALHYFGLYILVYYLI